MRPILADEWRRLREIRLRALASDPHAFSATHEHAQRIADEEWQARASASEIGRRSRWFVAVDRSDEWQGVAFTQGLPDSEDAGLFSMWVAPGARGMGLAAALCDACAAWAAERGYAGVTLDVMAENVDAAAAYRRMGFLEYDRVTESRGGRVFDLVMMRRALG